ncbi:MAG: glycosyltransferase family 4 protein [Chromatiales bacterium]|nr:glycosyltransferase family 4 protein [Chromatiales bacterium]
MNAFRSQAMMNHWPELHTLRYLVSVGNFVPRKSQDIIIAAFASLASDYPDLHLVLAGGQDNGTWLRHLRQLIDSRKLQDRITLVIDVPHERIAALIGHACAFVHAASSEPFGLVLIEAGALDIPVIAAAVGGVPEVTGADGALLYESGNVEQLTTHLRDLLTKPEQTTKMTNRMSQRVHERFSIEAMTLGYLKEYA